MAIQFLAIFNKQIEQNKSFIEAMVEVIEQYSEYYWEEVIGKKTPTGVGRVKDDICVALNDLYDHLFNFIEQKKSLEECIGRVIISYGFKTTMPEDFLQVFEAAKERELADMIELSKARAPSTLVADCENKAAAEGFSAEVVFAQTAILEKALKRKQIIRQSHIEETEAKVAEWIQLLYQKFAGLILESPSLEQLKILVDKNFKEDLIVELEQLKEFKKEIDCQIEFLENKTFFDKYHAKANLADKYDFVFDVYHTLKAQSVMTPELKMTLSGLFFNILDKANQPIKAEKFNLMSNHGTVESVFKGTFKFMEDKYADIKNKDLYAELAGRLQQEQDTYKVWEEASHRILDTPETYRTYQPLMRNLYTMKYAGDPNQDPKELLAKLPIPANFPGSPMKTKLSATTVAMRIEMPKQGLPFTLAELAQLKAQRP